MGCSVAVAGVLAVLASSPLAAHAQTAETTTYTYNRDGALTSVTTVTVLANGEVTRGRPLLHLG